MLPHAVILGGYGVFGSLIADQLAPDKNIEVVTDGSQHALALVARKNGPRVPTAPAVLLARKVLNDGPPAISVHQCLGFLTLAEIAAFLAPFDILLAQGENGRWQYHGQPA